jgi:hypothetical protein
VLNYERLLAFLDDFLGHFEVGVETGEGLHLAVEGGETRLDAGQGLLQGLLGGDEFPRTQ